jgi:hypothetical protein
MKARNWFSIILVTTCIHAYSHPVHISVVNIDIIPDSNTIAYAVGLFYPDLQVLINFKYNTLIDFDRDVSMTSVEYRAILDYVHANLVLTDMLSDTLSIEFLRWKLEDEMIWLFFCTEYKPEDNALNIQNTLMLDLYSDQKNYVLIRKEAFEEGIEFNKRKTNHRMGI